MEYFYDEILNFEQPTKYIVSDTSYNDSYETPVLTAGKSFILGKTNEKEGLFTKLPVIIFDDFTADSRYVDFPFKVKSSAMKMLSPKNKNINLKYVHYSMKYRKYIPKSHNRQWLSTYSKFILLMPDITLQNKIVAKLDKLQEIIELKKEQLKELEKLSKSLFYEMFGDPITNEKGWETMAISKCAPIRQFLGKIEKYKNQYWLLNLDMIESNSSRIIDKVYMTYDDIGNSVIKFNNENVLYSKLRPYLNKVICPNSSGYATSELIAFKPIADLLNRKFLCELLRGNSFVNFISSKVAGAKMPRVSMDILKSFQVIIPPIELQNLFTIRIETIENQKEMINTSIQETQTLFDSLMQKYFD